MWFILLVGQPIVKAICDLARSYDLAVVEDCSQAHGARIHGQSVGSLVTLVHGVFAKTRSLLLLERVAWSLRPPPVYGFHLGLQGSW